MLTEASLTEILKKSFEKSFKLRLVKAGVFQIFLPYYHEDGDMIDIFVQSYGDKILLTDFGKTMMRLSYYTDLDSPTRKKIFDSLLASYYVEYKDGKLMVLVDDLDSLFAYIMEFITVITKVSDISFLKQERVKSLFYEYFDTFMTKDLAKKLNVEVVKDYSPTFDKKREYGSPYAILKKDRPPILFFPILNDDRCKDTMITLLTYKNNNVDNKSIGIFNDFNEVSTKVSGKLIDMVDRPLTTFEDNKEKILEYVAELCNA